MIEVDGQHHAKDMRQTRRAVPLRKPLRLRSPTNGQRTIQQCYSGGVPSTTSRTISLARAAVAGSTKTRM